MEQLLTNRRFVCLPFCRCRFADRVSVGQEDDDGEFAVVSSEFV
jgi:hypothetical protein